jgi:CHASE3 domain sensor protein
VGDAGRAGIAIGAFLIALAGFDRLDRSFENVATARAITIESRELRLALLDAETGQRGFALTGDVQYLKPYTLAAARLPRIRSELARLTAGRRRRARSVQRTSRRTSTGCSRTGGSRSTW